MSGRTATVAALLAALLLARCPACSSTVSSPGAPPAREHESYFEGWGEGYDADDGPRAALANAAQIAADVDPSPVEDDIDALDQPAAKLEVREVRWEDEEATRSKLGRAQIPRRRRGRLPVRLPADSHARGGRRLHAHHDGGVVQASARAPDARAPAGRTERPALGNARVGSLGEGRAGGGAAAPAVPRLVRRRRRARGPAGDVPAGLQGAHLPATRADRLGDAGSHAGAAPAVGRGARSPVPTRDQLQPSTGPKGGDGGGAQGARGGDGGADGPVHPVRGAAREARAARSELQGG